jgi:hypothetical protein
MDACRLKVDPNASWTRLSHLRMNPQWQFPLEALRHTPSCISIVDEMSRRQRGVDWLMRMGATLNMYIVNQ